MAQFRKPAFYYNELLKMNYYFFIGWPPANFSYYMKKYFDHEPKMNLANGKTLLCENDSGRVVCIWTSHSAKKQEGLITLAHECVHAAMFTLNAIGSTPTPDEDEVLAYTVEHILRKALEA